MSRMDVRSSAPMAILEVSVGAAKSRGVTIEARYTVGEYDILILSAKESNGLELWLTENGYRIPAGASRVLGGYIKQGMKFFVAKVNLVEQKKLGFSYLRPIQVAFESPKFMLPIRLGMVNADGPQELFVFALTFVACAPQFTAEGTKCDADHACPGPRVAGAAVSCKPSCG